MLVLDQTQETTEPTALDLSDDANSSFSLHYTAADLAEWNARRDEHLKNPSSGLRWEQVRDQLMAKYR